MSRARSDRARNRGHVSHSLRSGGGEGNFVPTFNSIWTGGQLHTGEFGNGGVLHTFSAAPTFQTAFAPMSGMIDGNYQDNNGPYIGTFAATGDNAWMKFVFDEAIDLRGFRRINGEAFHFFDYMPQRSDDAGSSWIDLALAPLAWTNTDSFFSPSVRNYTRGGEGLWDNGVKSRYYRFVLRSNGLVQGRYCNEIEFKVMAHPLAGGDRTSQITFTSNRADRNGRALSIAFNGKNDLDASNGNYNSFDQLNVNDYLQFHFDSAVRIRRMQLTYNGNETFASRGTFKWQYSDDGSAWTDASGNVNAYGAVSLCRQPYWPGASVNAGAHTYWRFVKTVAGGDGLNAGFKDIIFDLANE